MKSRPGCAVVPGDERTGQRCMSSVSYKGTMCHCWCRGCLCLGYIFHASADQSLGWLWPRDPRALGSLCMCLLCMSGECAFPQWSHFLWSVINHVYSLDPVCTQEGQMRSHLDWSTPWHGQVGGTFHSPLFCFTTKCRQDTIPTWPMGHLCGKEIVIKDHLAKSKGQEGIVTNARDQSLPAFVREGRAQDVSSSQRPRCSISADAAFIGWESRWPREDIIRVDVVPEWKFVWTSGYFILLDKSQFQGT